jgi:hypothetical protein
VFKDSVLWNAMPSSPLKINQCFGVKYHLHLQGLEISEAKMEHVAITVGSGFSATAPCYKPNDRTLHDPVC